jgi:hypothetical protein
VIRCCALSLSLLLLSVRFYSVMCVCANLACWVTQPQMSLDRATHADSLDRATNADSLEATGQPLKSLWDRWLCWLLGDRLMLCSGLDSQQNLIRPFESNICLNMCIFLVCDPVLCSTSCAFPLQVWICLFSLCVIPRFAPLHVLTHCMRVC